jgi:hypothetical protein
MQITNNSNQSFKALSFTPKALKSLSERMPAGKFMSEQERLVNMYKDSPLDIVVDTTSQESIRLCAKIRQSSSNKIKKMIPQYIEEDVFSSIFNRTESFFKKLCEKIDRREVLLTGKISRSEH